VIKKTMSESKNIFWMYLALSSLVIMLIVVSSLNIHLAQQQFYTSVMMFDIFVIIIAIIEIILCIFCIGENMKNSSKIKSNQNRE